MADGGPVVGLLGPLVLFHPNGPEPVTGHAGRILLELAVRGRTCSRADLSEAVWGHGAPPTAASALRVHLTRLRRMLEGTEASLVTDGSGLRLAGARSDLERFEALVARARFLNAPDGTSRDTAAAAALVAEALGWWRGDPCSPYEADAALAAFVQRVRDRHAEVVELAVDLALVQGRHEGLVGDIEQAVADEPFREKRWVQLVIALYRSGRQRDALAAFDRARSRLVDELGIEPGPELQRVHHAVLLQDPSLEWRPPRSEAAKTSVGPAPAAVPDRPAATAATTTVVPTGAEPLLLGRERELAQLRAAALSPGFASVVGPPGIGASSLARALVLGQGGGPGDLLDDARREHRAWVADLTTLNASEMVPMLIADAMGLRVDPGSGTDLLDAVDATLSLGPSLLVLDGGEHLDLRPVVDRLVEDATADRALVLTRRTPLGHPSEHTVALGPLPPEAALGLLRRRVAPVADAGADEALARIAALVEGHPLAIELVASWVDLLGARTVADQLAAGSLPLADHGEPPLVDRVEATLDLLGSAPRDAFPALAAFAGDFDVAAMAAVTGLSDRESLAVLRGLRKVALVVPGGRTGRWRLVPAIADAARSMADRSGVLAEARRRQLEHLRRSLRPWGADAYGLDPHGVRAVVEPLLDDLRAHLAEAIREGRVDDAVDVFEGMYWYWDAVGHHEKAVVAADHITAAAVRTGGHPAIGRVRAAGILATGTFASIAARLDEAEAALAEVDAASDPIGLHMARMAVAVGVGWRGDLSRAEQLLQRCIDEAGALPPFMAIMPIEFLGILHIATGRFDRSRDLLRQARDAFADLGSEWGETHALTFLGLLAEAEGDGERAAAKYRAAAGKAASCGDRHSELHARLGLADLLAANGRSAEAADGYRLLIGDLVARGDLGCAAQACCGLAEVSDASQAATAVDLAEAASMARRAGDSGTVARALAGLTEHVLAGGDATRAAELLGALDAEDPHPSGGGRPVRSADADRLGEVGRSVDRVLAAAADGARRRGAQRGLAAVLAEVKSEGRFRVRG